MSVFETIVILALIYLWWRTRGLNKRLEALQRSHDLATPAASAPDTGTDTGAADAPAVSAAAAADATSDVQPRTGPWVPPEADAAPAEPPAEPQAPSRFVMTGARLSQFGGWLKENWFIAIAAISLGLAGVFFVQYGIEKGILSPTLRVICAIGLGLALIAGGEVIRRRIGDDHDLAATLPSALSGAGLVAMAAGIIAARQLYGLIGPGPAFAGLLATGVLAIVLGWFYGPFLIAFGILGTTAAPFLVGGESNDSWLLMYYFAVIAAAGMAVDAIKRSAWVTALSLAAPTLGAALIWAGTATAAHHAVAYGLLVALASVAIPPLSLRPVHGGPSMLAAARWRGKSGWPEFPTRIAAAGILIALVAAGLASMAGVAEFWVGLIAAMLVFAATVLWLHRAPALDDMALLAGLTATGIIAWHGLAWLPAVADWTRTELAPEQAPPMTITALTAAGVAISALAAFAAFSRTRHAAHWATGAAVAAPVVMIAVDLWWEPTLHLGLATWALHVIAVAAAMTALAVRAAPRFAGDPMPKAVFALAAMVLLGLAATILLTKAALTLAFAVLTAAAAWLDRRYTLPPMRFFVQIGALACSYRLVIDPGFLWAGEAPWLDVLAAYAGTIALLSAAWLALPQDTRRQALMVVESVIATITAVFVTVVLYRLLDAGVGIDNHWSLSLFALIWGVSAAAQLYRARGGGALRRVRLVLAFIFALIGLFLMIFALLLNPVAGITTPVAGPPILDSLLVAYLLPAALMGWIAWYFTELRTWLRWFVGGLGAFCAGFYIALEIRRLWRGRDLSVTGVTDGEMYTYTLALIVLSAALLAAALLRRSSFLRKAGLAVAALAVAKVFLLDASGLEGLIRVFSFLLLGLALGGLALVNRWIIRLQEADAPPPQPES